MSPSILIPTCGFGGAAGDRLGAQLGIGVCFGKTEWFSDERRGAKSPNASVISLEPRDAWGLAGPPVAAGCLHARVPAA